MNFHLGWKSAEESSSSCTCAAPKPLSCVTYIFDQQFPNHILSKGLEWGHCDREVVARVHRAIHFIWPVLLTFFLSQSEEISWQCFVVNSWVFLGGFFLLTFPSKHLVSMTTVGSLYSQIIRQKSLTVLAMGPVPIKITHAWLSLYYILADLRYLELQYNSLFFHIPEQVILSLIITNRNKCIVRPATYIQKAGINIVRALLSWNLPQLHTRKVI